jgi:DUF971 family protein
MIRKSVMTTGQAVYPVSMKVEGGDRLVIEWSDSVRHEITWADLRKNCPCAGCRTEREKPVPLLPIITIEQAQAPKPQSIVPVGRYAYQFHWNDGHESGIYSFEVLRQLGAQAQAETAGKTR